MKNKNHYLFLAAFLSITFCDAQFKDRYWCFGDSSAIDFQNPNFPIAAFSTIRARGSCASICDSAGNLLFYAASPDWGGFINGIYPLGVVMNKNHQLMDNGDLLNARVWYQEMTIIPDPGNNNRFYLFHIGVTSSPFPGIYYSVIDLSFNGGLGRVIQKNVQLQSFQTSDCIAAVKHGNGRDWWILFRRWDNSNNLYYEYLVSPTGISGPQVVNIGTFSDAGFFRMKFTKDGSRLFSFDTYNLIESYNFDRCTGTLSNPNTIIPSVANPGPGGQWSFALSKDESKLYTTEILRGNNGDTSYLFQYDLNAPSVPNSKDTMAMFVNPVVAGLLSKGPDDKIYLSCQYTGSGTQFSYLYSDSMFNISNTNLSVINYPDSLNPACDFQQFSFYLGGHRSYSGLPNNPNYELGPWIGSICNTITGLPEFENRVSISIFPNPTSAISWINVSNLHSKFNNIIVYDVYGNQLFRKNEPGSIGHLTTSIDLAGFPNAVYIIIIETDSGRITGRIVKQ